MSTEASFTFLLQIIFSQQMPATLLVSDQWTRSDVLSLIGAIAGAIGAVAAVAALWPYVRQRIAERRISRDFGADLYLPIVIRDATRFYVRPDASSVDLSQEMEERSNRVPTREDLFRAVERFLDDESKHRHMLLLADSGMGKSAFVLNFYAYNKRRFALKRYRLAVVPLGHAKALDKIKEVENKRDTIIFLDAFDEDPAARGDYWVRLKVLMEECSEFKRVLITCRTQFFPKDDAIPITTGLVKVGPRNDEAHYEFWRLYIAPLSDEQVEKYLRYRYHTWEIHKRRKARRIIHKIPLLTIRPMLLANIPEIMKTNVSVTFSWQLYELMVRAWYKRELGWWPNIKTIQTFSEEIAVKLHLNYLHQKADRIARSELSTFINELSVPVDEWNATTRSLLHRDAEGNFKFAHRSIMEYLFIKRYVAGDKRCRNVGWTDQMQQFMVEILRTPRIAENDLTVWLRYDLRGADLHWADLTGVSLEGKDLSGSNFNSAILKKANLYRTRVAGASFIEADLSDANLTDADVNARSFSEDAAPRTNFRSAKLSRARLGGANLINCDFTDSDLSYANLERAKLRGVTFRQANLTNADLRGARLVDADFTGADLSGAIISNADIPAMARSGLPTLKTSFCGANLKKARGLTMAQVSGAEIDEATTLPQIFDDLKSDILQRQRDVEEDKRRRWTLRKDAQ